LSVFIVGSVVDCVLDTTVPDARQQRLERHITCAFTRAEDQDGASPARSLFDKNALDSISALAINLGKGSVSFACMECGEVLARNRDIRIERENEGVPARGDCVVALHEIAGGDVAQAVRAGVRRAGRIRVEGMGCDQMGECAEFIAGLARCIGERAVNQWICRRDRA
jgi:predicted RNA-binding Zn-ribbon protein involved in translation (DUF1610 family)